MYMIEHIDISYFSRKFHQNYTYMLLFAQGFKMSYHLYQGFFYIFFTF